MKPSLLGLILAGTLAACGASPTQQSPPSSPEPVLSEAPDAVESTAEPDPEPEPASEPTVVAESAAPDPETVEPVPVPAEEPPPPSDVPGANMHVSSVTTDGVTITNVDCRTAGGGLGGLLGTLVIGKPFADRKSRLDRCTTNPHETRVRWTAAGGKMTNVRVISGDNPANACISRALEGAMATVAGECAASVEIGK